VVCGTRFVSQRCYRSRGEGHGLCCSTKCAGIRRRTIRKAELGTALIQRRCEKCGKEFSKYPSQTKGNMGRFCSKECAHGKPRDFQNGPCRHCGNIIFSRHPQTYCSRSCARIGSSPNRKEWPSATCMSCHK